MSATETGPTERPLRPALKRGFRLRCPACGEGRILRDYLKVREGCGACGQSFAPQRADDGPAYLTILVVGHVMGLALHLMFLTYDAESPSVFQTHPFLTGVVFALLAAGTSLAALPRFKGMMITYQWAKRMHGF